MKAVENAAFSATYKTVEQATHNKWLDDKPPGSPHQLHRSDQKALWEKGYPNGIVNQHNDGNDQNQDKQKAKLNDKKVKQYVYLYDDKAKTVKKAEVTTGIQDFCLNYLDKNQQLKKIYFK